MGITLPGNSNLNTVYAVNTGNIDISSQLVEVSKYCALPMALSLPISNMKRTKVVRMLNPLQITVPILLPPCVRTPSKNGTMKQKTNIAN